MLTKAVESEVPCKCCGNTSVLYDVCDFNKSCLDHNGQVFPVKGVPIYYHKCRSCGFIFTAAFDDWPLSAFRTHIYNDQYIQVDPDYKALRPNANAKFIISAFKRVKEEIRIVDYGGGDGVLAGSLTRAGFTNVTTYEPFNPKYSGFPNEKYNIVLSYEVIEHVPDPIGTLKEMVSLLDSNNGFVLFTTLLQPVDIDKAKTRWWYISPRNGHISIHSSKSLHTILSGLGFTFGSMNSNLHIAFKEVPSFAKHIIKAKKTSAKD